MFRKIFSAAYAYSEDLRKNFFLSGRSEKIDWKIIIIAFTAAFCLSMIWYLGQFEFLLKLMVQTGNENMAEELKFSASTEIIRLGWWVAVICVFYFLVPVIVVKFVLRENLSGYGLVRKGAFADYPLYGVLLAIMIPLVICASFTEGFQEKYPFYHFRQGEPLWPNLWTWEALYFLQFFALEFFFRGFLLHGIKHRFGFYSVFVMTILYCMIHFGKPLPETIAAIFAGIILGALSLKSRSILLGVAIHYSVAILMDLAALWQKGFLWNE